MREEKKIDDIEKFIQETKKDYEEWNLGDSPWYPWFRGEPAELKGSKPLLPRLYRGNPPGDYYENRLLQHFRMRAEAYGNAPHRDYTDQWLFLAQHVGLPTRLLDWTESSLFALWFALQAQKQEKKEKAIVWMLLLKAFRSSSLVNWFRDSLRASSTSNETRSEDIISGHLEISSDRDFLRKYVIDSTKSKDIMDHLRILGISYRTLFPDLDGLAKDLTELFRPDLVDRFVNEQEMPK